jgi:hypothetical protein
MRSGDLNLTWVNLASSVAVETKRAGPADLIGLPTNPPKHSQGGGDQTPRSP